MKFLNVQIPEPTGYLIPIGDVHLGSRHFTKASKIKLKGYLDWVAETPGAKIFLLGDLFDVATRLSKTSPFESRPEEVEEGIDLFKPYAQHIIGAVDGNHEGRQIDFMGWSATKILCKILNVPYCGWSATVRLQVGRREKQWFHNTYTGFFHHTTGGGTLGGSLNRIVKLKDIMEGCDFYAGGHNHQLATGVTTIYSPTSKRIEQKKLTFVSCGSYLDYPDSYAERGMYAPSKLGSPRIRLSGERDHHDIHISL